MKIKIIKVPEGELKIPEGATFHEAKLIVKQYIQSQIHRICLKSFGQDKDYIDRETEKYLPFTKYLSYEKSDS